MQNQPTPMPACLIEGGEKQIACPDSVQCAEGPLGGRESQSLKREGMQAGGRCVQKKCRQQACRQCAGR